MPIKVQNNLPAKKIMEQENIFMMDETRATTQNIRPLYIAVLNLMPLKGRYGGSAATQFIQYAIADRDYIFDNSIVYW